ncbi:hypothetical protein [Deinococcus marmoris]|uniref:hypothetical protein n=1 Tax=Deinococcus marmoris TaxID=249408 RepID=UPI000AFFEB33|nr:hypothetical protein [Deinococcus marmoris]
MTSLRPPSLHQPTLHPRLDSMDLTEATWRGRAIRYVAIYLALALLLVGARSLTRDIRPELRVAQDQEAKLLIQRNDLAVAVQTLENPQRIRDWAFANGMVRFAEAAPKESQAILPLPPPGQGDAPVSPAQSQNAQPRNAQSQETQPDNAVSDNAVPNNTVEVRTLWR